MQGAACLCRSLGHIHLEKPPEKNKVLLLKADLESSSQKVSYLSNHTL